MHLPASWLAPRLSPTWKEEMMAPKIGFQDGIEAARRRWNDPIDPGRAWPDKLAETLRTLKQGHNETQDRLAAVEEAVAKLPFPFRARS
jgi:hypothetical protein